MQCFENTETCFGKTCAFHGCVDLPILVLLLQGVDASQMQISYLPNSTPTYGETDRKTDRQLKHHDFLTEREWQTGFPLSDLFSDVDSKEDEFGFFVGSVQRLQGGSCHLSYRLRVGRAAELP